MNESFGTVPRLPVPRLPPLKFWALVPHNIWTDTFTPRKLGVPSVP